MARLTDTNMTPAERAAFSHLQAAVGFASKVYFGRDAVVNGGVFQRIVEDDTHILYALAVQDAGAQHGKGGVREFRLLIAPVPVTLGNGTREAAQPRRRRAAPTTARTMSHAARARISAGMKAMYAKRRAAKEVKHVS